MWLIDDPPFIPPPPPPPPRRPSSLPTAEPNCIRCPSPFLRDVGPGNRGTWEGEGATEGGTQEWEAHTVRRENAPRLLSWPVFRPSMLLPAPRSPLTTIYPTPGPTNTTRDPNDAGRPTTGGWRHDDRTGAQQDGCTTPQWGTTRRGHDGTTGPRRPKT